MRIIIGITGATGGIYGVRLLQRLREADVETHLVISKWGARTLLHETPYSREQVEALATEVYAPNDMGAAIVKKASATGEPLREVAIAEGVDPKLYDETINLRKIAAGNQPV